MPSLECRDCDGTGETGIKYRPDGRAIFQLGKPRCSECAGLGEVPTSRSEHLMARVRELRADGHTYRSVAEHVHREFRGLWDPPDNQLAGESLCFEAGVDREAEFRAFCEERREKNRC